MEYEAEREEAAYFMRRLYDKNLTTCSGGNVSLKVNSSTICITPSGFDKGRIKAEEIGIVTLDGKNLTPNLKPSVETKMHIAVYEKRPDIKAIVHAHPVTASSFTATEKKIDTALIAESAAIIGKPSYTPYALQGSYELAELVAGAAVNSNTILIANHGVLAVGKTMLEAFDRIEVLEAAAKITLYTEILGSRRGLSESQLSELVSDIQSAGDTERKLIEVIVKAVLDKIQSN